MYLLLQVVLISSVAVGQEDTIVSTVYGDVEGHLVRLGNGQVVRSFLGVPYAEAPVDDLRFRAPEEPVPWLDVLEADRLGDACPQDNLLIPITNPDFDRFNEDCLYLNIITPYNHSEPGPYPVHVFIHGGAYRLGANVQYSGHFYAARGVIFVAPNYRLGPLGYLYTGDDAARGNYGLMDQILALRFVRDNIANFGGDPNRVTVSGQSAGGSSVGQLIVSPQAAGLFQQAMMLSGTDLSSWSVNRPEVAVNITRQVAEDVDCLDDDSDVMVDCLRLLSVEEIMNATWWPYPSQGATLGFVPVADAVDGVLPDYPINLRERGQFSRVQILTGITDKEAGILYTLEEDGFNSTEFREELESFLESSFGQYGVRTIESIIKAATFQYTPWPNIENRTANRDYLIQIRDDLAFGLATDSALRFHSAHSVSYQYVFGYRSELMDEDFPRFVGAFHAADMGYFMGRTLLEDNPEVAQDLEMSVTSFNQTDKDYTNYWMDLMTNFIKFGNPTPSPVPAPGGKPATTWAPYRRDAMNYLEVYNQTILVKQNLRQRYFALWREYVPFLINHTASPGDDTVLPMQAPYDLNDQFLFSYM